MWIVRIVHNGHQYDNWAHSVICFLDQQKSYIVLDGQKIKSTHYKSYTTTATQYKDKTYMIKNYSVRHNTSNIYTKIPTVKNIVCTTIYA